MVGALWGGTAHAANNTLSATDPKVNSTVAVSPKTITMQFVNTVGPNPKVDVTCGNPAVVQNTGTPVLQPDQHTVTMSLLESLPKGTCTVIWKVSDAQLQPAGTGSFAFAIANDASSVTTTAPGTPTTKAPDGGVTTTTVATSGGASTSGGSGSQGPLALFRLLSTLGVAIVFGSLLVIRLAWNEGIEYKLTHTFLRISWGVALIGTYLFVGATAVSHSGSSIGAALSPAGWTGIIDTAPGKAALFRLLAIAATGWVVMRPERTLDPTTRLPAFVIPLAAVLAIGISRDQYGPIEYLLGAIHAVSMATWLGGAVLVARVVLAGSGDRDLVVAVRTYSKYAIPAVAVTLASGALLALEVDGSNVATGHGVVLVLKTIVALGMAAVAVMARQGVMMRTRPNGQMTTQLSFTLRRVFSLQMLIGVLVLALTSWLLALDPPGLTTTSSVKLQLGSAHRFQNAGLGVDVTLRFSERVGTNDVRIEVAAPDTGLSGLEFDFVPPNGSTVNGMAIAPIPLTGKGAAILTQDKGFTLSTSGTWTVVARLGGQEIESTDIYISSGA